MEAFVVRGGRTLDGTVAVSGAKNSALKLLAAALLAPGRTTLESVPDIVDIAAMVEVVRHLGARVSRQADRLAVEVPEEIGTTTPPELVTRLRASIVVLGPVLARQGRARLAQPGGCDLGNRAINLHLDGLRAMGAEVDVGADYLEVTAPRGLSGVDLDLPYASVGATENLLMAAVLATGRTRILNAAREPEIADLAAFLVAMGAEVRGAGTPEIVIEGRAELAPAAHRVVGDRIEAGTFAVAGALAGGAVTVQGVDPEHLRRPLEKLREAGCSVETGARGFCVEAHRPIGAFDALTLPFPGFPTDLQPQFLVLQTQAVGTSMLTENVFDGRLRVVEQLRLLGADIHSEGHHVVVRGPRQLLGDTVTATDLRAGAALVLAGLVADGETVVADAHHVDRGYSDFAGKLQRLGADVHRRAAVVAGA